MSEPQQVGRARYGGFDAWRIAAALGVVLTHSFSRTGNFDDRPKVYVGDAVLAFGNVGVAIFFTISGFLVAMSAQRSPSRWVFVRNRVVRIYPALIALVVFTTFVLGALVTTRSLADYFSERDTYSYLVHDVTLVFGVRLGLPGVFNGEPVNGSLWTLPYEVWAYVALLGLAAVGALRRTWVVVGLFVLVVAMYRFGTYGQDLNIRYSIWGLHLWKAAELGAFFLAGVLILTLRPLVEPRRLALPGLGMVVLAFVAQEPALFVVGLPMVVIGSGARSNRMTDAVSSLGDPSYGIYIFSYPIQQVLAHRVHIDAPWTMFALSATLATVLGYASWHLLEKRALAWAKTPRPPTSPPEHPDAYPGTATARA